MRAQQHPKADAGQATVPVHTDEFAIYGDIGVSYWSDYVTASDVRDWLRTRDSNARLTVRINSPGGDAFEGVAIYNLLRDAPQHVTVKIDGVALSAASIIAMAGNEVRMAENALLMIHDPWTIAMGNAAEMRGTADKLDKVAEALATTYARKTGESSSTMRDLMAAETWFSAAEALASKLVDAVDGAPAASAAPQSRFAAAAGTRPWLRRASPHATPFATAQNADPNRTAPKERPMSQELQAALNKSNEELGSAKRERDEQRARADKATEQAQAHEAQNKVLCAERDAALAKAKAYEDEEAARVVDSLVGKKFTAAERDHQVKLFRSDRALFEALAAQRTELTILQHDPVKAGGNPPPTTTQRRPVSRRQAM